MTHLLPPMLLNLFAPRPPLRWVEPADHAPEKRCTPKISGIGQYLQAMKEYKDNDGYVPTDSWLQKRDRKKQEKKEKQERLLSEGITDCMSTPQTCIASHTNSVQTNPAKTLKFRVTPSRLFSCPVLPLALPRMTSSENLADTARLNAFASSKTSRPHQMRRPRSESADMPSSCTSVRRT